MQRNLFTSTLLMLTLLMLFSACSSKDGSNSDGAAAQTSPAAGRPSASASQPPSPAGDFPRTIKDANGDFTVKQRPQKVAVVHWGYADSILLFNLPSLALALPFTETNSVLQSESYKPYVSKVKELKIVGENTQVNMESLLAYGPDLIIAGNAINKDIAAGLAKIAPTVVIDEQTTDVWSDWPSLVTKFGEILGQEETAAAYIADYKAKLQAAKEKLAGLDGTVGFLQVREKEVWLQGTQYATQYYDGIGLKPPASGNVKEGSQLSLEGLVAVNPDYLFLGYFNYNNKSIPSLTDEWDDNAVWSRLNAVKNKHVYGIDGQLALGYGPIGQSYGLKAVLDALGKP